jgi:transketolase
MYTANTSLTKPTVGLIVTGTLLYNALMAAAELEKRGIPVSVLHVPTIKPLDTEALVSFAEEHQHLITIEEHQIAGGLGGAVVEYLSSVRPTRVTRLGVHDQFGQSGDPDELITHYGMDIKTIVGTAESLI